MFLTTSFGLSLSTHLSVNSVSIGFLNDTDFILRSIVKEIFEPPNDSSSILYSLKDCYGLSLGLMRASWEAHIQHNSISQNLIKVNNSYIMKFQHL